MKTAGHVDDPRSIPCPFPGSPGLPQPRPAHPQQLAEKGGRRHRVRCASAKFDSRTWAPRQELSYNTVSQRLSRSCLHEFPDEEAQRRIELAAAYRLFGMRGWNDNIFNHLTAKIHLPDGGEAFLINAFGLRYDEVTASSLLTITVDGDLIHPGVVGDIFGVNKAGFVIHSALHRARPDALSVMHSHYAPSAGVSCMKAGLEELAQTTHVLGPIAYHEYEGIVVDMAEQARLQEDTGSANTIILRNHGVITLGDSVGAAWTTMDQLMLACDIQCHAQGAGRQELHYPAPETVARTYEIMQTFTGKSAGILEFSAYMRQLDKLDPSYRL